MGETRKLVRIIDRENDTDFIADGSEEWARDGKDLRGAVYMLASMRGEPVGIAGVAGFPVDEDGA